MGSTLGGLTGIPGASALGGWAGNAISQFMGWGDYAIGVNSLINPGGGLNVSKGVDASNIRVRHSEFLGDITVQTAATPFTLALNQVVNPGNAALFPWLSTMADNYEQWIPKGIVFEFKSTASTNSASTNLGSVAFASDYDVYDDAPTSRVQMLQMAFSQDNSVAVNQAHGLECDPRQNPNGMFWILHKGEQIEGSAREYHLCTTYASAGNAAVAGIVGQLWVHYDIVLCKERPPRNLSGIYDQWTITSTSGDTFSAANPLGISLSTLVYQHVPSTSDAEIRLNPSQYIFPSSVNVGQEYLFMVRWRCAAAGTMTVPEPTYANCALGTDDTGITKLWRSGTAANNENSNLIFGTATGSVANQHLVMLVKITGVAGRASLTWPLGFTGMPLTNPSSVIDLTVFRVL